MSNDSTSTILAVTQDSDLRMVLERALKRDRAYRLSIVSTGREALSRLESHDVDLVICDSDGAGDQKSVLLAKVRLSHPRLPRVIVASQRSLGEADKLARDSAAYLFLTKPVVV